MAIRITSNNYGGRVSISSRGLGGRFQYVADPVPLLLDTYAGAAAAYSLRKLRNDYSGPAIRVRRSSDNAEQDIGFTSGQLNTASLLTFCGANNGFVTKWYDQSGNSKDAVQTTTLNQPQIVNAGIYLGYLNYDGIYTFLIATSGNTIAWNGSTGAHVVTVTSPNATTPNGGFDNASTVSIPYTGAWGIIYQTVGPTFLKWRFGSSQAGNDESYTRTNSTAFCLVNTNKNSSTETLYLNNSLVKTATGKLTTLANNSSTTINIGRGDPNGGGGLWKGFQKEIVMYATDQTANVSGINTNINSYYTIY